ncbi:MAG: outer membrane protein assembly factor BamD [Deltaproteobacteria bacterium]|nr:outer membrane protein assembly factor BamD [Deltaproteobacteria bacterium]MBW1928115.1 outer membrane protein assembly factor BamD [Deltaproteobacteria bacterium]MBW2025690.1 outer membrane protein assembly factor BamD [Deltaproteobacteria bacterium]MBW2125569.1 outer membrane protein assembly factor BamD [Deltaproteobacteria bacterium]
MSRKYGLPATFIALSMIAMLMSGCGLYNSLFGGEEPETPRALMEKGMESLQSGHYDSAIDAFEKIKDRYPYSRYALTAALKLADALYRKGSYDEAYDVYDEFEKLHPKNPEIPYVIYQKGMCHFRQVGSIDRDQSHTVKAKEEFERLIKRFPRSHYAALAEKRLRCCYIDLAEHELYVGRFYFKMKKYQAARGRFLYVLKHYPDVGQYHEALKYLRMCEEKLAEEEDKQAKKD